MIKKLYATLLMLTIMFSIASCAYFQSPTPDRRPAPPNQRRDVQAPPLVRDNLAKSDTEGIEENINAQNIEDDIRITQIAESHELIQTRTTLTPEEIQQEIRNGTGENVGQVIHEYRTTLPDRLGEDIQYNEYAISYDYLLITAEEKISIRETPSTKASEVCAAYNDEKFSLLMSVQGDTIEGENTWFMVSCKDNGDIKTGFVHASAGIPRSFQFEKMMNAAQILSQELQNGEMHFISNYKNANGAPPSKGDSGIDEFGLRIYQSAPGYERPDTEADFRYVPDGMIVRIIGENDDFYRVNVSSFGEDYWIPKRYIDRDEPLNRITHVVVVDRAQQNQVAFEFTNDGLMLKSYTLATTGVRGDYSFETPLGHYKAIQKRDRFEYLAKGTTEIKGYAPFAVRFCGGAYIHGVPVEYEIEEGERIDPGLEEYLHTIGTFPRSSMCVRNFTSHAKFIHEWMEIETGAVIIIE